MLKPLLTEKSLRLAKAGQFTFLVDRAAAKPAIAAAVEKAHKVEVVSVSATGVKPKTKRTGKRRLPTLTPAGKKAVVRLKPGQSIEAFSAKGDKKS